MLKKVVATLKSKKGVHLVFPSFQSSFTHIKVCQSNIPTFCWPKTMNIYELMIASTSLNWTETLCFIYLYPFLKKSLTGQKYWNTPYGCPWLSLHIYLQWRSFTTFSFVKQGMILVWWPVCNKLKSNEAICKIYKEITINYVHPPGGWIYYFCFFRHPMSVVRCPMSGVRCPASHMVSTHLKEKY